MLKDEQDIIRILTEMLRPKVIVEKQAQQAVDPNTIKTLATKLISNLEKNFGISTEKPDTALYMKDLQSLDELLSFLRNEDIQYNGKWIVSDYGKLSNDDKKLYAPYKLAGGYEGFAATMQVGVYKDGLINYLRSIEASAQKNDDTQGKLVSTMVEKLVGEANAKLNLGMTSGQATTIPDNQPLDSIDIPLDYNNPTATPRDAGRIMITPAILKSKATFDDWAKHLTMRKDNKVVEYGNFTDANYCDVLHILYVRATQYAYRRGEDLDKTYLKLIEDLAVQYKCQLETGTETGAGKSEYKQTGYEEGQPQSELSPQQVQALQPLIMKMPLLGDRIDFPRLSRWLNDFARINKDPNTAVDINNALQVINNISSKYRISSQPLAQEATQIARRVIQNATGNVAEKTNAPSAYLQQLSTLMSYMGAILGDLKNKIYDSIPEQDQELKDQLDTQIGTDASSFYEINADKIQTWVSDLPEALQSMRSTGF